MVDKIQRVVSEVFRDIPDSFLVGLLVLFCAGAFLLLMLGGWKKGARWSAGLLLSEYMALMVVSAVLTRKVHTARSFDFTPFWSYRAIMEGNPNLLIQNIANVSAFVPIGFLLGCAFRRIKWWKVLAFCGGFSILIEMLQLVFMRGFAEFDDVFHNLLGSVIGFGLYVLTTWLIRQISPLADAQSK